MLFRSSIYEKVKTTLPENGSNYLRLLSFVAGGRLGLKLRYFLLSQGLFVLGRS